MWGIERIHEQYQPHQPRAFATPKTVLFHSLKKSEPIDRVTISTDAVFRAQLDTMSKQYAAASAPIYQPISEDRMSQLKIQYQGTNCPISGADVANAMLGRAVLHLQSNREAIS